MRVWVKPSLASEKARNPKRGRLGDPSKRSGSVCGTLLTATPLKLTTSGGQPMRCYMQTGKPPWRPWMPSGTWRAPRAAVPLLMDESPKGMTKPGELRSFAPGGAATEGETH